MKQKVVIAETIATYFELAERERTLALTQENVDLLAERFELTQQIRLSVTRM